MSLRTTVPDRPPTLRLRRLISRYPLGAYFLLAFALSWLVVLPMLLARMGLAFGSADMPAEPFQMAGAFAGPTLSAFIVTAVQSGRPGVRRLFDRYKQWRVGLQWYLLVFFGPLLALTLGAVPFLGVSIIGAFMRTLPLLVTSFLPILVLGIILGPLWEEPGWRGFALPRLQDRHGPIFGTLVLGVLWSLWHLPGFIGGWLGSLTASSVIALTLGTIAGSFILTWVYNNTGGSILMMILLHSSINAASAFGGNLLPAEMPVAIASLVYSGWIPAATYTVWALLIILLTRGRLSYSESLAK